MTSFCYIFKIQLLYLFYLKKYFYNYEGHGLRYMIYSFLRVIEDENHADFKHSRQEVLRSTAIMDKFHKGHYTKIDM